MTRRLFLTTLNIAAVILADQTASAQPTALYPIPGGAVAGASPIWPLSVTRVLLPGHWQLKGARYVWVPPETRLRPVQLRPLVLGESVWKDGRWVYVPSHYVRDDGS